MSARHQAGFERLGPLALDSTRLTSPDDKLIVPGVRIGRWTLAMTMGDVIGMLGSANRILPSAAQGSDLQTDMRAFVWVAAGSHILHVHTRDGRSIVMMDLTEAPEFVTDKGVKRGMSRADVEAAHGRPTRVTQYGQDPAQVTFIYDGTGLEVLFNPNSQVHGIGIFHPGTAPSIWKP